MSGLSCLEGSKEASGRPRGRPEVLRKERVARRRTRAMEIAEQRRGRCWRQAATRATVAAVEGEGGSVRDEFGESGGGRGWAREAPAEGVKGGGDGWTAGSAERKGGGR